MDQNWPLEDLGLYESARYKREWDLLSASDLDDDGVVDRFYAMETVSLYLGSCELDQLLRDEGVQGGYAEWARLNVELTCEDGRLKYGTFQRVQFYDKLFNYDYNDVDSDGVANHEDFAPYDSGESTDTDGDGVGDQSDRYPEDPNESQDTDNDGVGNNADDDDDGDGVPDTSDAFPARPRRDHRHRR